jgi:hypothetical protein
LTSGVLHDAAGLTILANVAIPGLPTAAASRPPDIHIHVDSRPSWANAPFQTLHTSPYTNAHGTSVVTVQRAPAGFHFDYADGTHVWMDDTGREIWCTDAPGATLADTATYLTGPVFGFALRRRGALALHASAVTAGSRAVLMVGPHGAGKSTTAAALTTRGCALITDDVMHLRQDGVEWVAEHYRTGIRLWPDAVAFLLGEHARLPRVTPTWDKHVLQVSSVTDDPLPRAVPVGFIVFLENREDGAEAPRLAAVGAAEAVVRLATHSSASLLLDDRARADEFKALGALVQRVACTRAIPSADPNRLQALVDLLLRWSAVGAVPNAG